MVDLLGGAQTCRQPCRSSQQVCKEGLIDSTFNEAVLHVGAVVSLLSVMASVLSCIIVLTKTQPGKYTFMTA